MTIEVENKMRVYVGTYGKYNHGSIQGEWLNIEDYNSIDEFHDACYQIHAKELKMFGDVELMFQDFEGIPRALISEFHISPILFDIKNYLDGIDINDLFEFVDEFGFDYENTDSAQYLIDKFNESYMGCNTNFRDFVYDHFDLEFPDIDDNNPIMRHFDWRSYENELKQYYIHTPSGNVFYTGF
jgi:antirestriction protein|tara:strand:+ start:668 stop:1219 length:552 start_codon:yes stop_codon:yes gene_type:complete